MLPKPRYSGVDVSPTAGWGDRASFLGWLAADLVRQTTLPGFALALLGLWALASDGGLAAVAAAGSGVLVLLGSSLVLILLLGFDFEPLWLGVFRPYPLVCYGVAALWVSVGQQRLMDRLPRWTAARIPLAALTGAALVAVPVYAGWPANNRTGSDFAERYAEVVFALLPQGAVLFVYGEYTGPLGYYRYVEERRPDVAMYNLQGLVFGNRLFDPLRLTETEERASALDRFVDSTESPVFLLPDFDIYPSDRGIGHHGFVLEVLGEGTVGTVDLTRDPLGERYFLELLDLRPVDRWERDRRNSLLFRYGNYLGLVVLSGSPILLDPMAELFERADDCYTCLLGMAVSLLNNDAAGHAGRIAAWLARAEALHDQALSKLEFAQLPFEQGRLAELTGDADTAAASYRQAYVLFPHPEGAASAAIRRLGLAP